MSAISAALPRARALSPRLVLGAIVLLGALLQSLLASTLATPGLFPDEYLYSQLGRSLATTGHLSVRGVDPHFLPVLAPILNAPLWLVHDVGTAYRLIQVENALLLSLAAIPAYWLARRLGSGTAVALAAAVLAVTGPPAVYSARILAEPIAYPLFLAVLAAGIEVVDRPSARRQLLFLVLATLATLARLQLALLPLCVVIALVVVAVRERRVRATLREQRLLVGAIVGALALGLLVLAVRGFGYYKVGIRATSAGDAGRLFGVDLLVVLLATGAALAPSAVVGIAQAIARPRHRAELVFGLLASLVTVGSLAQCVLWGDVGLVQERYLIYLVPLLAVAFCVRRSRPNRRPVAEIGVAAGVAALAALVPLTSYAIDDGGHLVPTLDTIAQTQVWLHSPSAAAAVFALGGTALAAFGAATTAFRRLTLVTLLVSLAAATTILGLATLRAHDDAAMARHNFLPADRHWIDHVAPGDKTVVVIGKASKSSTLTNLFWNPSVTHVTRTRNAGPTDWLDDPFTIVGDDGTMRVGGKPLTGTVVMASDPVAVVVLANARPLAVNGPMTVWHADGPARLGIILYNRTLNGEVLQTGAYRVWQHGGWLVQKITAPQGHVPGTVRFGGDGVDLTVHVRADGTAVARIPVCGKGGWKGAFIASPAGPWHNSWRAPIFAKPRFVPDPRACS